MDGLDSEALQIVETCLGFDDPEQQARTIMEATAGRPALRTRVETLLGLSNRPFRLLATEQFDAGAGAPVAIPDQVGPFRITGFLGDGGMGSVLRAERADGVFEQVVAIKVIRADIADPRARERFEAERRILARLDHPGIARILDGGETDGRPWLAMEYIAGEPVTAALDATGATLDQRMDCFLAVAEAVAHAHRNLVVHADIKPGNALMRADGAIKLLDFGIARLIVDLDRDETATPYPLTRGYAAPERIAGAMPTISGDVYSLGVLLHEMLTGSLPVEGTQPSALPAGPVDPARLRGDIDAILARALSPDPATRYPDTAALMAELRAFRLDMPVAANAQAGWRSRTIKFLRRHRTGVAMTASVIALLALAAGGAIFLYVRAERARAEAEARFGDVRALSRFMLFDLYDDLADSPGTVGARARLADMARRYLDRLQKVPDAPVDLRLDIARGWRRLATVEGLSGASSLGRPDVARTSLDKAQAQLSAILADDPDNAGAIEEEGWVTLGHWLLMPDSSASPQVNALAAARFQRALTLDPGRQGARLGLITTRKNRGFDLIWGDRPAQAIPVLKDGLTQLRGRPFGAALTRDARSLEVNILFRIGDAVYYAGDRPGSLPWYREGDRLIRAQLARKPSVVWIDKLGEAKFNLAGTLEEDSASWAEALRELEVGIDMLQRTLAFGWDANLEKRLRVLYSQYALVLSDLGRHAEAAQAAKQSVDLREARLRDQPGDPHIRRDVAVAMPNYAMILAKAGREKEACAAARRGVVLWAEVARRGDLGKRDERVEIPEARAMVVKYCR